MPNYIRRQKIKIWQVALCYFYRTCVWEGRYPGGDIFFWFWAFYSLFCFQALAKAVGIEKTTAAGAPRAPVGRAGGAPLLFF